jgi:Putative Actinobacterial Holin-X, holin superfamily III
MAHRSSQRSILDIGSDLLAQFPILVRKEAQLARAELSEKISRVGMGLAFIGIGAVLLIPALVVLLIAAVNALQDAGFEPAIAALIVGGSALLIGIILLLIGINRMKVENLVPNKTIHQLQEDALVAKQQVRAANDYDRAA